ncbi:KilA-N domain-containing protein [Candidatus Peregrinibacteria bacterium]|nr:KilA-N domain-containing protein [Candidatus Peregrinibacteria bacterium]
MKKDKKIEVKGLKISLFQKNQYDYICITDIAKYKNSKETSLVIAHWLRTGYTIEFLGIWEQLHNPVFNTTEFGSIKNQSISNSFILTTNQWVSKTNAIGIFSKAGRYGGGTFAHKDIAFEFASWISPEFKLYLIKEFQRLKEAENQNLSLGWDVKRELAKVNYKIHTDAIKQNLIPLKIDQIPEKFVYASEGDLLNKALFNVTAKEWREQNPKKEGNIRDYATIEQLVVLSNLESMNAEFINQGMEPKERLPRLNQIAIYQMTSILGHPALKKLQ